jgi:hypothetical protein
VLKIVLQNVVTDIGSPGSILKIFGYLVFGALLIEGGGGWFGGGGVIGRPPVIGIKNCGEGNGYACRICSLIGYMYLFCDATTVGSLSCYFFIFFFRLTLSESLESSEERFRSRERSLPRSRSRLSREDFFLSFFLSFFFFFRSSSEPIFSYKYTF